MKRTELLQQLQLEGFLSLEQVEPSAALFERAAGSDSHETPIYIRLLAGASAWLITSLLFYLINDLFLLSRSVALVIGSISTVSAVALAFLFQKNSFFKPLSTALALLGQYLVVAGIFDLRLNQHVSYALIIGYELFLLCIFPAFLVRFVATAISAVCAIFWLMASFPFSYDTLFNLLVALYMPLVWLLFSFDSLSIVRRIDQITRPAGYALAVVAHIALLVSILVGMLGHIALVYTQFEFWILYLSLFALILWQLVTIVDSSFAWSDLWVWVLLVLFILVCVAASQMPALLAPLSLLLLAKQRGETILFYLACVFLLLFLGLYYYNLDLTLLTKSLTLLGTGALLLGLRSVLRYLSAEREVLS